MMLLYPTIVQSTMKTHLQLGEILQAEARRLAKAAAPIQEVAKRQRSRKRCAEAFASSQLGLGSRVGSQHFYHLSKLLRGLKARGIGAETLLNAWHLHGRVAEAHGKQRNQYQLGLSSRTVSA